MIFHNCIDFNDIIHRKKFSDQTIFVCKRMSQLQMWLFEILSMTHSSDSTTRDHIIPLMFIVPSHFVVKLNPTDESLPLQ